jgi:sensor histidine kinase YesM
MEMDPLVETVPIPPLSVLTFVENAVKHAARPTEVLCIFR